MTSPRPLRLAGTLDASSARVCVLIPVRNEVANIRMTLEAVLHQRFPIARMEVVVIDGESDDGTRAVLDSLADDTHRIRILDNPIRTIPHGLNLGIAATSADVVIRVDGRCGIAPDYVEQCLELLASTQAGNVGGLARAHGHTAIERAIALAMRSRFGIGNSHYHYLEREEYVDTVYMGAFRRDVLSEVGGYDEELVRNQDDELNYRIRAAGYGILLSPRIVSRYTPPGSLLTLWKSQFYQYGFWKVRVIQKHPRSLQPRHLAPALLVAGLSASGASSALFRKRQLLAPAVLYALAVITAASWTARRTPRLTPVLSIVFPCMHLGYGAGFVAGLFRFLSPSARRRRAG